MAEIESIMIKCGACSADFRSPIFIADSETFESGILVGNSAQCPKCGAMVKCNKENMTYRLKSGRGGYRGNDIGDLS